MKKRSEWAAVFDFDGTLVPKGPSLFAQVEERALSAEAFGRMAALRKRFLPKAIAGKLTLEEETRWLIETLEEYLNDGLTRDRVSKALKHVRLRPGALDCLKLLAANGVPAAIVSYGVTQFIEVVLDNNGAAGLIDRVYSTEMTVSPETGHYVGFNRESIVLPTNKGRWSRDFAERCGVLRQRLIAIGDTGGDRDLGCLATRRIGIAKDANEAAKMAPYMGRVVITEDFGPVTEWLKKTLDLA